MRVIQVVQSLRNGGAETIGTSFAVQQKKLGEDVFCIVYGGKEADTPNCTRLKEACIPVFYVNNKYEQSNTVYKRLSNLFYREMTFNRLIKDIDPDIIHFHYTRFQTIFFALLLNRKPKAFYTIHSWLSVVFKSRFQYFIAKILAKANRITLFVLHKQMQLDADSLFGKGHTIIVNNGIDLAKFRMAKTKRLETREMLNFSDGDFVIGHIGSFIPVKNHKMIIEIFESVRVKSQIQNYY